MYLENVPNENLINGMKKSFNNAESLLEEADLLASNKRYARAYCLCQIAIEELAKIWMLFYLWGDRINNKTINYPQLNKDYKNHPIKIKISIEAENVFYKLYEEQTGHEWITKLINQNEELLSQVNDLNNLKNASLYVSIKNGDFQSPIEVIDERKYKSISAIAFLRKEMSKNIIRVFENHTDEIVKLIRESEA